ncbi:MAG: serine acetyltransferase [Ruminococcaceae bacterium]|nr:serine acetyltransferase [Oscillospiraceae bacterium]
MTINEKAALEMVQQYEKASITTFSSSLKLPDKKEIISILNDIQGLFFPAYFADCTHCAGSFAEERISSISFKIKKQIELALMLKDKSEAGKKAKEIANDFIANLPRVHDMLLKDVEATYEGDPAAESKEAIVFCYPGLYAIFVYRVANLLYKSGVPFVPRIMTEHAHSMTGIDINPGATIGEYFFIDHGTGIVIGETTEIGNHVKIYQGVTLGALSPRKGQSLSGVKRHPTVCDNVTIYSGASILGGETVIGEGAVIGGNSFITESISAGSRVYVKKPEHIIKN